MKEEKIKIKVTTLAPILDYLKEHEETAIFKVVYNLLSYIIEDSEDRLYVYIEKAMLKDIYDLLNNDYDAPNSFFLALEDIKEALEPKEDFDFAKYLNDFLKEIKEPLPKNNRISYKAEKEIIKKINNFTEKQYNKDSSINRLSCKYEEKDDELIMTFKGKNNG